MEILISEDGEVVQPPLHDARIRGLVMCGGAKLIVPIETSDGARLCLVLHEVERLRADDFRQGNIILDVSISSAVEVDVSDVAYAYGVGPAETAFLSQTMERLVREKKQVVRINPSFGCTAVCICGRMEAATDSLPQ
jgi:hypothetical protein